MDQSKYGIEQLIDRYNYLIDSPKILIDSLAD